MIHNFCHYRASPDFPFLEKRLLCKEKPSQKMPEIAEKSDDAAKIPSNPTQTFEEVYGSPSWFTRFLLNITHGVKMSVEGVLYAVHGIGRTPVGLWQWAQGNAQEAWNGLQVTANTAQKYTQFVAQELKRGTIDAISTTSQEIKNRISTLFSSEDTTWKNFWWKKPWQAVRTMASPVTGASRGYANWIIGTPENKDEKSLPGRFLEALLGQQQESGIRGIIGATQDLVAQTFWKGPIQTQMRQTATGAGEVLTGAAKIGGAIAGNLAGIIPFWGKDKGAAELDISAWRAKGPDYLSDLQLPPAFAA